MKEKLTNFNIIPTGDQNKIPLFYKWIIASLNLMKKIDLKNEFNYKSKTHFSLKNIYEKLEKNNFIKPKIEQ